MEIKDNKIGKIVWSMEYKSYIELFLANSEMLWGEDNDLYISRLCIQGKDHVAGG
jgi:hypothetical protein